jgi:NAD dependent epimerase/dehydratase family enzyme
MSSVNHAQQGKKTKMQFDGTIKFTFRSSRVIITSKKLYLNQNKMTSYITWIRHNATGAYNHESISYLQNSEKHLTLFKAMQLRSTKISMCNFMC